MEVKYNNTAGRLLAIFHEARKHKEAEQTHIVWRQVLGIPGEASNKAPRPDDVAQVYSHLVPMVTGLDETEGEIRRERPDVADLYTKDFVALRIALAPPNLSGPWRDTKSKITDLALHQLELCANALPKEGKVTQDELRQIAGAVNELFDHVRSSGIRKPLKRWILELLSAIKKSIDNYHIFGAHGLRKSFSMLAGEIRLYGEALNEVKQQDPTIFTKFGQVFQKVRGVLIKAKEWWPLLKEAGKVLQLPFDEGVGGDGIGVNS